MNDADLFQQIANNKHRAQTAEQKLNRIAALVNGARHNAAERGKQIPSMSLLGQITEILNDDT